MKKTFKNLKSKISSRPLVIGIDAGGTKVRGVLMSDKKILKKSEKLHDAAIITKEVFLNTLLKVIDELWDKKIKRIGLGLPGPVENNKVKPGGRVKSLNQIDFEKLLEKKYKTDVVLDNDVKTALRFEVLQYKKFNSIFMITLGTGIGGAWWLNNKIMKGSFSSGYEIGQMVFEKNNPEAFEVKLSGRGFFRNLKTLPIESENAARRGNLYHKKIWREFGRNLGLALANLINLIEPELIVVGGGIVHAWPLFAPDARKTIQKLVLSPQARKKTKIVKAVDDRWAGAIGAVMMAQSKNPNF